MFYKKKYIFETKQTKTWRFLKSSTIVLLSCVILHVLFCIFIIIYSNQLKTETEQAFFQRPPSLVVIFTGDAGRIPQGLKLAYELQQPNIFITGVYSKNTVNTLIKPLDKVDYLQDPNFLEIDYIARNTVENVISTLRYVEEKGIESDVIIVSHDYHILRIKMIMNRLKRERSKANFYYHGVESNYRSWRNLKVLNREVFKLIRAYAFLLLWDPDTTQRSVSAPLLD